MSMIVNDKKIDISSFDTDLSILQKIAIQHNTLVKYLFFSPHFSLNPNSRFIMLDLKDLASKLLFPDYLESWISFPNISEKEKMLLFAMHQKFTTEVEKQAVILYFESLEKKYPTPYEIEIFTKKLQDEIKELKISYEKGYKLNKELVEYKPTFSLPLIINRITFEIVFDYAFDILELFNSVQLTENIPFCTVRNYYKVFNNFTPNPEWEWNFQNIMMIKMLDSKDPNVKQDQISTLRAYIKDKKCHVEIETNLLVTISNDEIVKQIVDIFKLDKNIQIISNRQTAIKGNIYYPNFQIQKEIISDMILNDELFSNHLYSDDSMYISKKKRGIFLYYQDEESHVSFSIFNKFPNIKMSQNDSKNFPLEQMYVQVKFIKAKNEYEINKVNAYLSKLFSAYTRKKSKISLIYQEYVSEFIQLKKKPTKVQLTNIDPNLFVRNYTRKCANPPVIISHEEAKGYKGDVMLFPKTAEEGTQRYYVCKREPYTFPGLIKNTLQNKGKYPYLPCCYKENQKSKENSGYRKYMRGVHVTDRVMEHVIQTEKLLMVDRYGVLTPELESLLKDGMRLGMNSSNSTLIECLCYATDTKFQKLSVNQRLDKVNSLRLKYGDDDNLLLCKQEFYNQSLNEIKAIVKDFTVYFSPRQFIRYLEHEFRCNIFVFNSKGVLYPFHSNNYLQYKYQYDKNVIIFENSKVQNISQNKRHTVYQCELVVFDKNEYLLNKNKIVKDIKIAYNKTVIQFSASKEITMFDPLKNLNIIGQMFDSFGKVHILEFSNGIFAKLSRPYPPMALQQSKSFRPSSLDSVLNFIESNKFTVKSQYLLNDQLIELNAVKDRVELCFLISPIQSPLKIEIVFDRQFPPIEESNVTLFNDYYKTSIYLFEYFVFLCSKFMFERGQIKLTNTMFDTFMNQTITIVPNKTYSQISRYFDLENPNLIQNGKLMLPSTELVHRYIYTLVYWYNTNRKKVIDYHKHKYIQNYYVNIDCFKEFDTQNIVFGKESFYSLCIQKQKFKLFNNIPVKNDQTIFISNPSIEDGQVLIAVPFDTLNSCLHNSYSFARQKEEIQEYVQSFCYKFYYINGDTVHCENRLGRYRFKTDPCILVYKTNDKVNYVSLLTV